MLLTFFWIWVAHRLGCMYQGASKRNFFNKPPLVTHPLVDHTINHGEAFEFAIPVDSFTDPDPGDVLQLSAKLADGSPLPDWLEFDAEMMAFSGKVASDASDSLEIIVTATDFNGASVSSLMRLNMIKQSMPVSSN